MNAIVKEWLVKAEADYYSAGFHAQQCLEKYLKAILQLHKIPFQKIHDLLALMESCSSVFPQLVLHRKALAFLNQFAVLFRYPGETAGKEAAKKALTTLKVVRQDIRGYLKLDKL